MKYPFGKCDLFLSIEPHNFKVIPALFILASCFALQTMPFLQSCIAVQVYSDLADNEVDLGETLFKKTVVHSKQSKNFKCYCLSFFTP